MQALKRTDKNQLASSFHGLETSPSFWRLVMAAGQTRPALAPGTDVSLRMPSVWGWVHASAVLSRCGWATTM